VIADYMHMVSVAKGYLRQRNNVDQDFETLYKKLNPEQKQAVDITEGPVMVLAGPGTGKTHVLTMRVANILRVTQMDPWNILCLTFTESAASEMRQRLISIIGETAYTVRIHTFHSFCNDIIQSHPEKFSVARQWQVLSQVEQVEIIRECIESLSGTSPLKPFGNTDLYLTEIIRAIAQIKKEAINGAQYRVLLEKTKQFVDNAQTSVEQFISLNPTDRTSENIKELQQSLKAAAIKSDSGMLGMQINKLFSNLNEQSKLVSGKRETSKLRTKFKNDLKRWFNKLLRELPKQRDLLEIFELYQKKLLNLGRYDYDDMVLQVIEKFRADPELLAKYQEQFQYILIDEYQDTNGAQNEAVALLGSFDPSPNIFVVGDDKQSIFRFQGASLENLLKFYVRYRQNVKVISLTHNYRSQPKILAAADDLIRHNNELAASYVPGVVNTLVASSERVSAKIHEIELENEDDENYYVAETCASLIKSGVEPSAIAILFRYNKDAESIYDTLIQLEIPTLKLAGQNILRVGVIEQLLQLLEYVVGQGGDEKLTAILHFDFIGLDALDVVKTVAYANDNRKKLQLVLSDVKALQKAGVSNTAPLIDLATRLAKWQQQTYNLTVPQFLDLVLNQSGLLSYAVEKRQQATLLNSITVIFNEARQLSQSGVVISITEFIGRIRLLTELGIPLNSSASYIHDQSVRLISVHKAKGQEFEHVFVIRLNDKHWGNARERNGITLPAGILSFDPVGGQNNNEDERRLFYVAITRAKQELYLTYTRRNLDGREQVPSLFTTEILAEHLKREQPKLSKAEKVKHLERLHTLSNKAVITDDLQDWLKTRLSNCVMSVTHLNNYLECPRLFYYRNLLRVPSAKTKHLALGTAIHKTLRDFYIRQAEENIVPKLDYLVDNFKKYLARENLVAVEYQDTLKVGKVALVKYYQHYHDLFKGAYLLEYNFKSHAVKLDDLSLTGQLDKVELLGGKKVNVVDYKTGNPDNSAKHLKSDGKYFRQLVFYKLLGDRSKQFKFNIVSGEIDFIQPSNRTGKFSRHKYDLSQVDVEELVITINQVWHEIKQLNLITGKHRPFCGKCEYCLRP
jgi:DNA helicase II / ATP-dependent DNA helicase PcrA